MLPNRFACPPDLPSTRFCEPCGPLAELSVWLTSVPAVAMPSESGAVRKIVSPTLGGWMNPPGSLWLVYGNGDEDGPRLSELPTAGDASSFAGSSTPGVSGT